MTLTERITELAGLSVTAIISQTVGYDAHGIVVLNLYFPAVDGVRQFEQAKLFVESIGTAQEKADYISKKPSVFASPDVEPTPIGTDAEILAATGRTWVKYEIKHTESEAYVTGYVSLMAGEVIQEIWIVQDSGKGLVAFQQKG
jgi:hypothetical protein